MGGVTCAGGRILLIAACLKLAAWPAFRVREAPDPWRTMTVAWSALLFTMGVRDAR